MLFGEKMTKYKNIPIFVAHKGCPNDCIFCNQVKISGAKDEIDEKNLRRILDDSILKIGDKETQIAFFGGSFTGIDRDVMIKYLCVAHEYVKKYNLNGIRLSTRPDYIDSEILGILKKYGVKTIELGVQSMNDLVLKKNERNMTSEIIKNSCRMIKENGFILGVQLMTSMYGSDTKTDIYSAYEAVKLKPDFVRIYPTVVIEGTKLWEFYRCGEYKTKTLDETVDICARMLGIFHDNGIEVIRIGLMTNEDINCENVKGAYHPAFGELVFSKRYYDLISKKIEGMETNNKVLTIVCKNSLVSKIAGQKRLNINKLKKEYGFSDVKFRYSDNDEIKTEIS